MTPSTRRPCGRRQRYMIETARVHGLAVAGKHRRGPRPDDGRATPRQRDRGRRSPRATARHHAPLTTGRRRHRARAARSATGARGLRPRARPLAHRARRRCDDPAFEALARGTGLPIVIYNVVPWTYLSPAASSPASSTSVEGVVGVKQSAGDLKLLADLLARSSASGCGSCRRWTPCFTRLSPRGRPRRHRRHMHAVPFGSASSCGMRCRPGTTSKRSHFTRSSCRCGTLSRRTTFPLT